MMFIHRQDSGNHAPDSFLPVEFSPVPVAVIRATWSTPILSASSVARVYDSSANNIVAWGKKHIT